MSGNDNIVDFESGKLTQIHKRKALRVEEMRKAFSEARAESTPKPKTKSQKRRRKTAKK
ncbi:MAG: hypothetical protein ACJAY7_001886 [Pseudohongiellaceae bacterium]|jgi:hypothetical protein